MPYSIIFSQQRIVKHQDKQQWRMEMFLWDSVHSPFEAQQVSMASFPSKEAA